MYLIFGILGGQPEYQLSHKQNFDNARFIFLVIDLQRDDNSEHFWINSIKEHVEQKKINIDELTVFIIGTKSKDNDVDKKKLNDIKTILSHNIKNIPIKIGFHNLIKNDIEEFKQINLNQQINKSIEDKFQIGGDDMLSSASHLAYEQIRILQKNKFYFKNRDELLNNFKNTSSISKIHMDSALKILKQAGVIEELGEFIILRPYWKNIFATSILRYAQDNEIVKSSISLENLKNYKFKTKFDELIDGEDKN